MNRLLLLTTIVFAQVLRADVVKDREDFLKSELYSKPSEPHYFLLLGSDGKIAAQIQSDKSALQGVAFGSLVSNSTDKLVIRDIDFRGMDLTGTSFANVIFANNVSFDGAKNINPHAFTGAFVMPGTSVTFKGATFYDPQGGQTHITQAPIVPVYKMF